MSTFMVLIKRNTKLFFKDKGMFFTSLITPVILLVLYVTFLGKVYRDTFVNFMPRQVPLSDSLIDGYVAAQLFSSLLAVCCVTVAFCANMLMVQDKVNGARGDLTISPVKHSMLALSYYISTVIVTMIVCLVATGACLLYVGKAGWYLSAMDVLLILLDIFLLVLFGTALSSLINFFLSTQGQISAVGTVVSSGYGFLCGAYMPISQFSEGLQTAMSFLPGTYGTSLLRHHTMRGVFAEMQAQGLSAEAIDAIRDSVDCNLYFFDTSVNTAVKYAVLGGTILLLMLAYILLNVWKGTGAKR